MKVQYQPKPQFLLSTFLVFFIIHANQVGIGIHGYQRIIFLEAKQDAWISVFLAGVLPLILSYLLLLKLYRYMVLQIFMAYTMMCMENGLERY